jgi:hypothetical protein
MGLNMRASTIRNAGKNTSHIRKLSIDYQSQLPTSPRTMHYVTNRISHTIIRSKEICNLNIVVLQDLANTQHKTRAQSSVAQ